MNKKQTRRRKWNWERLIILINELLPLTRPKIYHSFLIAKLIIEEAYAGKLLVRVCLVRGGNELLYPWYHIF